MCNTCFKKVSWDNFFKTSKITCFRSFFRGLLLTYHKKIHLVETRKSNRSISRRRNNWKDSLRFPHSEIFKILLSWPYHDQRRIYMCRKAYDRTLRHLQAKKCIIVFLELTFAVFCNSTVLIHGKDRRSNDDVIGADVIDGDSPTHPNTPWSRHLHPISFFSSYFF